MTIVGVACAVVAAAFVVTEGGDDVRLYQTTGAKGFREIATSGFTIHPYPAVRPLDIDAARERHCFAGLGAALTDAAAWILHRMPTDRRAALLRDLFTEAGVNLGVVRLNIGASDYSTGLYCYDDTPGDVSMHEFSLARDEGYLIPMMNEILSVRPDTFVFASPWSPPGWMKSSGLMVGGTLRPDCQDALANYFVAYLKGYAAHGVKIGAVTVQNETACDTEGQYPCCTYTPEAEGAFVRDSLRPAFAREGLDVKIWVHDHNYEDTNRVIRLLSESGVRSAVDGVAWHSYGKVGPEALVPLKESYGEKGFYHTEQGPSAVATNRTETWWARRVLGALNAGCETFTSWNLCLDELGMPATGAHTCGGFVVVDSETREVTSSSQYRLFRHIGPFVRRGARILAVEGDRDGCDLALFRNPDERLVLVVSCDGSFVRGKQRRRLVVKYGGKYKSLPLPAGQWSLSTLIFR